MEGGSEAEKMKPPEGGEVKSKRKMKTASQLEILEKTFAVEQYPPEAMRAELSTQLGLSDRQLQMWFCHRRLKDRKARQPKESQAVAAPEAVPAMGADTVSGPIPGPVVGPSSLPHPVVDTSRAAPRVGTAVARISRDFPPVKRYDEPQLSFSEHRAIAFVEAQLGEPLREDGPILGMEFDPLPPDAFGAPIGPVGKHHKPSRRNFEAAKYERLDAKPIKDVRLVQEYQFLPERPTVKSELHERAEASYNILQVNEQATPGNTLHGQLPTLNLMAAPPGRQGQLWTSGLEEYAADPQKNPYRNVEVHGVHPYMVVDPHTSSDRRIAHNEEVLRTERKRKSEEARIARELEAHEKRIRKELKRQDILRRKREEQMRKEMERLDRERRKEEERLLRDKQREEERYLREQRREMERREKFLQKESMRAEKMRQKEEIRRMKEAARLKAASERAIARRIAKESMELMEDARLELMEVATSSKGLPSIASLDYETLQNLDLFIDSLTAFPPKSVPLKRPFAVQPWLHSEENVANLLMVWRFLITFADVLHLWPFTLDEFVQAFHDYDARLLGEIHISLLKLIIKDIEDVARTPSINLGANQNGAANPGGGHPNIVEGAYTWGFDIRSWQRHLNPLTWPEILRQFALSAGFGPKMKMKNEPNHLYDDTEVNDGERVISNLRDGTAAENAFTKMQERGYSSLRRSRHRLTPGTVKFAAFHILSLEGSEGLNILEVAERIQKSGLRDLSTSKTPEASIAAALSRDTKLFERTAPSTYCVRPAYRKDPADAEAVLSAARERIRAFKSGTMEGEEEAEDAERDEGSESESGEDPEDDLATESNLSKEACEKAGNRLNPGESQVKGVKNDEISWAQVEIPQSDLIKDVSGASLVTRSLDAGKVRSSTDGVDINDEGIENNVDELETDIDESIPGELWVEGLMEGEYADLSVEERLGALVALIGVAIEGNAIRLVLEERLEAATALKKQMWAEAQLDKRRFREDYVMKTYYPSHTSYSLSANGRQSPSLAADDFRNGMAVDPSMQQEQMINRSAEESLQILDSFGGPEVLSLAQAGYVAERSRSQLKSFISYKAEEIHVYRSLPLGQDRRRNRYWRFTTSASRNDPGCGRIFVELRDGRWRLIDSEEGFDALLSVLDVRGIREWNLHSMLRKIEPLFKEIVRRNSLDAKVKKQSEESLSSTVDSPDSDASEASTSFLIELSGESGALKRYQDFENWMWRECISSILCAAKFGTKRCVELLRGCIRCHEVFAFEEEKCPSCHGNSGTSANDSHIPNHWVKHEEKPSIASASNINLCGSVSSPVRVRLLKIQLSAVEASVPSEAIADVWTNSNKMSWGAHLCSSLSAGDLLQALTILEGAIKRDYMSSKFETTSNLLSLSHPSNVLSDIKDVPLLPWVPKTTAAVALRLMELDSAILYTLQQMEDSKRDEGAQERSEFSLGYAATKNNIPSQGISETSHRNTPFGEDSWIDSGGLLGSSSHGRGARRRTRARTTGLRSQRTVGSRSVSRKRTERSGDVLAPRGRPRGRGGWKRGRRSARNRQKAPMRATQKEISPQKVKQSQVSAEDNDWNDDENELLPLEEGESSSSSERFEYGEENEQEMGSEYDDMMLDDYGGGFNRKSDDLMEGNEYEDGDDGDDGEEEEERGEELGVEGYVDGQESDEVRMRAGTGFGIDSMGPEEDAAAYTSSDYSEEDDS